LPLSSPARLSPRRPVPSHIPRPGVRWTSRPPTPQATDPWVASRRRSSRRCGWASKLAAQALQEGRQGGRPRWSPPNPRRRRGARVPVRPRRVPVDAGLPATFPKVRAATSLKRGDLPRPNPRTRNRDRGDGDIVQHRRGPAFHRRRARRQPTATFLAGEVSEGGPAAGRAHPHEATMRGRSRRCGRGGQLNRGSGRVIEAYAQPLRLRASCADFTGPRHRPLLPQRPAWWCWHYDEPRRHPTEPGSRA